MNELFKLGRITEKTMSSNTGTYCEHASGTTATVVVTPRQPC